MSAYEHVTTEIEDRVGIVTLNRPEVLNAMNNKLSSELHDAVKQMGADDAVGASSSRVPATGRLPPVGISTNSARTTRNTARKSSTRKGRCGAAAVMR